MSELADEPDSGSGGRKPVRVQVPVPAPAQNTRDPSLAQGAHAKCPPGERIRDAHRKRTTRCEDSRHRLRSSFFPRSRRENVSSRFRGYEEEGLRRLSLAREATGLAIVTEVLNRRDVELVYQHADMFQIGAGKISRFSERWKGSTSRCFLKRSFAATLEKWLLAAEYLLAEGNPNVVLCERAIRSFETYTRFTFDLSAIPAAKHLSHLPVTADPSHGTGRRHLVLPVARAAVAAGADGLIVEVHPDPDHSLTSDGKQSLPLTQFARLMEECRRVAFAVGRAL